MHTTAGALPAISRCLALVACLSALTLAAGAAPQPEGKRIALIIGNDAYSVRPLKNSVNDARIMDKALRAAGFRTILRENTTKTAMEEAIAEFLQQLGPDDTALFFYAGHGVQIENENFLVPVDFEAANSVIQAKFRCFSLALAIESLKHSRAKKTIIILDACRSNPLSESQSLQAGLAIPLNAGNDSYLAFSTSPNHVAGDNPNGRNSWFTEALAELIGQPGLDIDEIFTRVRSRVEKDTEGRQTPWSQTSLTAKFYFHPPATQESESDPTLPEKWMADAAVREQREDWPEAIDLVNQVLQKKPGAVLEDAARGKLSYLTLRRDAQARFDASDFAGAGGLYDKVFSVDPFAIDAAFQGAVSYLLNDQMDEALRLLKALRVRGDSDSVARTDAMLKELSAVSPEAAQELQAGPRQPPPVEEMFAGRSFGAPDFDAGKRSLEASPVELTRWVKELIDANPLPVAAPADSPTVNPGAAPAAPASGQAAAPVAPIGLEGFHVEVIATGNSRDLLIRKLGAAAQLNTSGVARPSGVSVKVKTDPPGAELTIDGDPDQHCQAPCILSLAPSRQVIRARLEGYRPEVRTVNVGASGEDVQMTLDQEFGFVQFDGPQGETAVLFDGKPVAQQVPAKLQFPVGKYEIRTVQDGKIVGRQDVEVKSLSTVAISVKK